MRVSLGKGRLVAIAAAATIATVGSLLGNSAASATTGAPAGVVPAITTPKYGMVCNTLVTGSTGAYWGHATCLGQGTWRAAVDCAWGLTYYSDWVRNGPGETKDAVAGACWWGVNQVRIEEY